MAKFILRCRSFQNPKQLAIRVAMACSHPNSDTNFNRLEQQIYGVSVCPKVIYGFRNSVLLKRLSVRRGKNAPSSDGWRIGPAVEGEPVEWQAQLFSSLLVRASASCTRFTLQSVWKDSKLEMYCINNLTMVLCFVKIGDANCGVRTNYITLALLYFGNYFGL